MSTEQRFFDLFRGREDRYGGWDGVAVNRPVTTWSFFNHLKGIGGVGIYTAMPDNTCLWGCVDIDTDDMPIAVNIQTALKMRGITSWVEKTRKGWHVWVFAQEPVALATMRRCLQAACAAVRYNPKEVNPKQEELTEKKPLGNYVRIPYFHGDKCIERYVVDVSIETGEIRRLTVEEFLDRAEATKASTEALEATAALYVPPPKVAPKVGVNASIESDIESLIKRLDGISFTIWRDGPLEGRDRSGTLTKLAYRLAEQQSLNDEERFAVLVDADKRWGKFQPEGREDAEDRLLEILERALSNTPRTR